MTLWVRKALSDLPKAIFSNVCQLASTCSLSLLDTAAKSSSNPTLRHLSNTPRLSELDSCNSEVVQ